MSKVVHKEIRVPFWIFPKCGVKITYKGLALFSWSWNKVTCKRCLAKLKKKKG